MLHMSVLQVVHASFVLVKYHTLPTSGCYNLSTILPPIGGSAAIQPYVAQVTPSGQFGSCTVIQTIPSQLEASYVICGGDISRPSPSSGRATDLVIESCNYCINCNSYNFINLNTCSSSSSYNEFFDCFSQTLSEDNSGELLFFSDSACAQYIGVPKVVLTSVFACNAGSFSAGNYSSGSQTFSTNGRFATLNIYSDLFCSQLQEVKTVQYSTCFSVGSTFAQLRGGVVFEDNMYPGTLAPTPPSLSPTATPTTLSPTHKPTSRPSSSPSAHPTLSPPPISSALVGAIVAAVVASLAAIGFATAFVLLYYRRRSDSTNGMETGDYFASPRVDHIPVAEVWHVPDSEEAPPPRPPKPASMHVA